jgi:hypothetical protein
MMIPKVEKISKAKRGSIKSLAAANTGVAKSVERSKADVVGIINSRGNGKTRPNIKYFKAAEYTKSKPIDGSPPCAATQVHGSLARAINANHPVQGLLNAPARVSTYGDPATMTTRATNRLGLPFQPAKYTNELDHLGCDVVSSPSNNPVDFSTALLTNQARFPVLQSAIPHPPINPMANLDNNAVVYDNAWNPRPGYVNVAPDVKFPAIDPFFMNARTDPLGKFGADTEWEWSKLVNPAFGNTDVDDFLVPAMVELESPKRELPKRRRDIDTEDEDRPVKKSRIEEEKKEDVYDPQLLEETDDHTLFDMNDYLHEGQDMW